MGWTPASQGAHQDLVRADAGSRAQLEGKGHRGGWEDNEDLVDVVDGKMAVRHSGITGRPF